MPLFTDASGRAWRIAIVYDTVCRIREQAGVDLLKPHEGDPPLWQRLQDDPGLFVDALHVACGGVSGAAFARSLRGSGLRRWWRGADPQALESPRLAFFAAWAEFWPEPRKDDDEPAGSEPVDIEKSLWQLAGVVGVHPGIFTLRQLVDMAEGCGRAAWAQTGILAAPLWNQIRDPKKKREPWVPADFNPYAPKKKKAPIRVKLRTLRPMFVTKGAVTLTERTDRQAMLDDLNRKGR